MRGVAGRPAPATAIQHTLKVISDSHTPDREKSKKLTVPYAGKTHRVRPAESVEAQSGFVRAAGRFPHARHRQTGFAEGEGIRAEKFNHGRSRMSGCGQCRPTRKTSRNPRLRRASPTHPLTSRSSLLTHSSFVRTLFSNFAC